MELKDFISETIKQISQGVISAIEECSELDVIVNPDISVGTNGEYYIPEEKQISRISMQRRVQQLDMDIAVTVTEASETSGGGKIGVSIFGANINSSGKSENTNISRVKFSIPVCFPITKLDIPKQERKIKNVGAL